MSRVSHNLGTLEYFCNTEPLLKLSCSSGLAFSSPHTCIFPFSESFRRREYITSGTAHVTKASRFLLSLKVQLHGDSKSSNKDLRFSDQLGLILSRLELWAQLGLSAKVEGVSTYSQYYFQVLLCLAPLDGFNDQDGMKRRPTAHASVSPPAGVPSLVLEELNLTVGLASNEKPNISGGIEDEMLDERDYVVQGTPWDALTHPNSSQTSSLDLSQGVCSSPPASSTSSPISSQPSNSCSTPAQDNQQGRYVENVAKLLDAALRKLVLGAKPSRMDIVEGQNDVVSNLQQFSLASTCPAYVEALQSRASFKSNIVNSLARIRQRARSPALQTKITDLGHLDASIYIPSLHHMSTESTFKHAVEAKLWTVMQEALKSPAVAKQKNGLKPPSDYSQILKQFSKALDDDILSETAEIAADTLFEDFGGMYPSHFSSFGLFEALNDDDTLLGVLELEDGSNQTLFDEDEDEPLGYYSVNLKCDIPRVLPSDDLFEECLDSYAGNRVVPSDSPELRPPPEAFDEEMLERMLFSGPSAPQCRPVLGQGLLHENGFGAYDAFLGQEQDEMLL